MSEKLLIVEDDKKLNDGIRLALKNDAYFFYQCRTLQEAREILKKEDITLVFTTVLYSEAEKKQIWNAAEEIVLKELVYIESVESSFGSFLLFIR